MACSAAVLEQTTGRRDDDSVSERSRTPPDLTGQGWPGPVWERDRAGEWGADVGGVAKSSMSERLSLLSSFGLPQGGAFGAAITAGSGSSAAGGGSSRVARVAFSTSVEAEQNFLSRSGLPFNLSIARLSIRAISGGTTR